MLSSDAILQNGRFRILDRSWSNGDATLYTAKDEDRNSAVVLCELRQPPTSEVAKSTSFDSLRGLSHEGLVSVQHSFSENGHKYLVTEPIPGLTPLPDSASLPRSIPPDRVYAGVKRLLSSLFYVSKSPDSASIPLLNVSFVRVDSRSELRLLYFGDIAGSEAKATTPKSDLSFQPLEQIWRGLDLASQNAIGNSYDDGSLEVLESTPDERSDLFTLGSIAYLLLTGQRPPDALERSIEILDGNPDPLVSPQTINASVTPEFSEFVLKLMRLRREDRYDSFDLASKRLAAIHIDTPQASGVSDDIWDDLELLEIPAVADPRPVFDPKPPDSNVEVRVANTTTLVDHESSPSVSMFTLPQIENPVQDRPANVVKNSGSGMLLADEAEPYSGIVRPALNSPVQPAVCPLGPPRRTISR